MLCKPKNKKYSKLKRIIITVVIILISFIVLFEAQAVPFTSKCVKKQSKSTSAKLIANKVHKTLNKLNYSYTDLAVINYSDSGTVQSISENTMYINRIKSEITDKIQDELDKQNVYRFKIPLGAFTDITLLSTLGPDIEINFILTGSVNCKIKSSFESAGINQTIHHIYLVIKTNIITVSPEYSDEIKFTTDYEIAQTVIVGGIPTTYADIVR